MIIGLLSTVFVLRFTTSIAFGVQLMVLGLVSAVVVLPRLTYLWGFMEVFGSSCESQGRDQGLALCLRECTENVLHGRMADKADNECIS